MTSEYKAAIEKHNEAIAAFKSAQVAYRTRLIGDDQFLAAKSVYDVATAEFDVAFAKEAQQ